MKRKSCSILFFVLFFNCPVIIGQLTYEYNGATFMLSGNRSVVFSDVVFSQQIRSSRMLTAQISQARLKSAELMGLYLVFTRSYPEDQQTNDLFPLFIKYYGKGFNVEISDLITKRNKEDSELRTIRFECPITNYEIKDISLPKLPDLKTLCEKDYRNSGNVYSADKFLKYCTVYPADQLRMDAGFLSRQNAPLPVMAKCFGLEPGTIFESSLFGSGEVVMPLVYELLAEKEVADNFSRRLILMDLVTVSPGTESKDEYYKMYLDGLKNSDELWDNILLFTSKYTEKREPQDVFDAIQRYPGALNMHLISGTNSKLYNEAIHLFNENKQDSALIRLRDAVNYNGVTPEKISLAAAVYRLQNKYKKALVMSVFSAFNGLETAYVPGNLYLSLQALGFPKTDELKNYFLKTLTCDTWSEKVIRDN